VSTMDDVVSVPFIGHRRGPGGKQPGGILHRSRNSRTASLADEQARDGNGAFKRQAARFRLFGRDAQQRVICEITARDATLHGPFTSRTRKRPGTTSTKLSTFLLEGREFRASARERPAQQEHHRRRPDAPGDRSRAPDIAEQCGADLRKARFDTGTFSEQRSTSARPGWTTRAASPSSGLRESKAPRGER